MTRDRGSPGGPGGSPDGGGPRKPKGYTEEAILSDDEVQRRVNVEGGGDLQPPPERKPRPRRPTKQESPARQGTSRVSRSKPAPPTPAANATDAAAAAGGTAAPEGMSPIDALRAQLRGESPSAQSATSTASPPATPGPALAGAATAGAAAAGAARASTEDVVAWDGGIGAASSPSLEVVERQRVAEDERRRQLWRDSATILIGVVLALLIGQSLFPQPLVGPAGSPTPLPSGINIGTFGPPVTIAPGASLTATFGPIINPSVPIDATPTPIPVITMGPTPTASPTPAPSPSPTRKPTPKPTVKPTATPRPPTAPPTPTPIPSPTVSVSCSVPLASMTVSCTANPTNIQAGSQVWTMDGTGALVSGGDGTNAITYTYADPGSHTVRITVTGLNGTTTTFDETPVMVPGV